MLLPVPGARRTRLAANLAGSRSSFEVAATAATDIDLHRNGTSFATIRFAAAAKAATFIAAT